MRDGKHLHVLETDRLVFRKWTGEDMDLAWDLWGDPAVTGLLGPPLSREQVGTRLRRELDFDREHGVQYWPIFLRETGEFVGCCGLRPRSRPGQGPGTIHELGFHLKPAFWGQGYAREAAAAVIRHAFETLGAVALFAGHHPENEASRRLLERLGFQFTHRELYPPTGLEHPSYLLTADDDRKRNGPAG